MTSQHLEVLKKGHIVRILVFKLFLVHNGAVRRSEKRRKDQA
jgi:hypothetical protein